MSDNIIFEASVFAVKQVCKQITDKILLMMLFVLFNQKDLLKVRNKE